MLQSWFDSRYNGLVTVVNSGGSGQHSGWGLANVKERVVGKRPNLVFIEFAINDAHVRFNLTPEAARTNLDGMIKANWSRGSGTTATDGRRSRDGRRPRRKSPNWRCRWRERTRVS